MNLFMTKPIICIALFFFFTSLLSCEKTETQQTKTYFDLNGILKQQLATLQKEQPTFQKTVTLNEQKETIETNKINWEKELELFLQSDINKPAFRMSYDSIKVSNMVKYQLKTGENAPVKELILLYDSNKQLSRVIISTATDNLLYNSAKNLKLELADNQLIGYSVKAFQELFIGNKNTVEIEAKRQ